MAALTTPAIAQLQKHYERLQGTTLLALFQQDSHRFSRFSREQFGLLIDFSKNFITDDILTSLFDFADERQLRQHIDDLCKGRSVNMSEHQPAEHVLLRDLSLSQSREALDQMEYWVQYIEALGITDVVHLGIGGSDLGPRLVCDAFLDQQCTSITLHFLSSPDTTDVQCLLRGLDPVTTLFLVASKSFSTEETIMNMINAQRWLLSVFDEEAMKKRIIIITANVARAKAMGISEDYIIPIWPTIGGRYSLWSAMGLIIALRIGMDGFKQLLKGAALMDRHFQETEWRDNIPVILALISFWYINFFNYPTQAVIPYAQRLRFFPDYLQQLHMESLGKSVNQQDEFLSYDTGPILWGGVGTDCQHSFHQLFMQGTHQVPIDFILPLQRGSLKTDNHLIAHCLAQSEILMVGHQTPSAPYGCITGNNPSTTMLMTDLNPEMLGALIALYEHKVFVNAALWGINPFDQWGVEQGKRLARSILNELTSSIPMAHDSSTMGLIERVICLKS